MLRGKQAAAKLSGSVGFTLHQELRFFTKSFSSDSCGEQEKCNSPFNGSAISFKHSIKFPENTLSSFLMTGKEIYLC